MTRINLLPPGSGYTQPPTVTVRDYHPHAKLLKIIGVISAFTVSISWFLFVLALAAEAWLSALLWLLTSAPYLAVVFISQDRREWPPVTRHLVSLLERISPNRRF